MAPEHQSPPDDTGSPFKSEAQMRLEASPFYQQILEIIQKLPVETKEWMISEVGAIQIQKAIQREREAIEDADQARKRHFAKHLGFGKLTFDKFLDAFQTLQRTHQNGDTPRREIIRDFDTGLFALLKLQDAREPIVRCLEGRTAIACRDNDHQFLKKLGRALSEKPKTYQELIHDNLDLFLSENWKEIKGSNPPIGLHNFSDPALLSYCKIRLNNSNLTRDLITHRRHTLGLRQSRKPGVIQVRNVKGEIWLTKSSQISVPKIGQSK